MKYIYYFRMYKGEYHRVTLAELREELKKLCTKETYINEWISLSEPDYTYIDRVIRAIRKGTYYIFSNNCSCYARKESD